MSTTLVAVLLAAGLPMPVAAAPAATVAAAATVPAPPPDAPPADPGEQAPSIAYEQAMAHAGDRIAFQAGGIVDVGFTPRPTDRWPVDGRAPAALPGGRATGRQMAASPQGSRWAVTTDHLRPHPVQGDPATADPGPADAPVDAPAGSPVEPASGAAYLAPGVAAVEPAAASGLRRQVFGFLPYWELSGASSKLNYNVLSTIAYFSVGATSKGDLRKKDADGSSTTGWGGWTSSSLTSVINAAHQRGTRVVLTISVFAWTSAQAAVQKALLGSSAARLNLARQAAAAVRDRGADGVNLDFEPLSAGYADEYVAFLRTMRSELSRIKRGYQLTYDTTGSIGNYPLEASVATGAADAIFVMGYDYRTGSSGAAGSVDPLSGPRYDLTDTVRAYTARVSPSRVILGLPWYGRAWSTTTSAVRAKSQSGLKFGSSAPVNYESLTDYVAKYGRRWDPVERSPYVVYRRENCTATYGCVTSWRQIYYDDGASLKLRLAMVNDYGLRGAGTWALGYDGGHPELYRAFAESFLIDKSAPQAGVRMLGATQGDEGFVVSWVAADTNRVVGYDVQVSIDGGAWATWLTGTKTTSEVWPGRDGHGYAFRVRARDSKGNGGAWNVASVWDATPSLAVGGFGRVVTNGLAYRTGPDTSAARLGSLAAGTIVAVTSGPVSADGYTWYEVTQPIREWNPVTFVERGVWIAARSSTVTHVTAYRAPNSTRVDAGITGLDFGSGASALGAAHAAERDFSPNRDGSEDTLRLRWTNTVAMTTLALRVFRSSGALVGSVTVPALAAGARSWTWDGRVNGARVADGRYVLQLVGKAGARTYTAPSARPVTAAQVGKYAVTVDDVAPKVSSAAASTTLVSPNGDGRLDTSRLSLSTTGATRWTIDIRNAAGTVVRSAAGTGGKAALTWAGIDAHGARVPDGRYIATAKGWDAAGNHAGRSWTITVDTTAPASTPSVSRRIFSPNADGADDTTGLRWSGSETSTGTARIYRGTKLVRSWKIAGRRTWAATWDGRTTAGKAAGDGAYTFRVSVRDAAGNGRTSSVPVTVDRTAGALRWSRSFFPQDRDALRPNASLSWRLTRSATTTLGLYDVSGKLLRTVWSGRRLDAGRRSWTWDGRLADGTTVPQGRYTARLAVTSTLGTQVLSRSVWASGFAVTPSSTTVAAGQTLSIAFSTVEPLAVRPKVTFAQPGRAAVTLTATRLANGTYRARFKVAAGAAGAASVRISAKDTGGHVNTTVVAIAVRAAR